MNFLSDILINLVAGFIGFSIGWIWQKLQKMARFRKARVFWKPFVNGDLQVVIGRFQKFATFEPTGFLSVGDAIGLTELSTYFESLGLKNFTVSYADQLDGDSLKTNLILIGGPDANAISKEVVNRVESGIQFGEPGHHEIAIRDRKTNNIYIPSRGINSNEVIKDYGAILRTANPFSPGKQILVIAGSFGFGTWAGIRFAMSRKFVENPIASSNKALECLVETDVVYGTPQDIRLIILRPIEPKSRAA